jgi:hypothetical protein
MPIVTARLQLCCSCIVTIEPSSNDAALHLSIIVACFPSALSRRWVVGKHWPAVVPLTLYGVYYSTPSNTTLEWDEIGFSSYLTNGSHLWHHPRAKKMVPLFSFRPMYTILHPSSCSLQYLVGITQPIADCRVKASRLRSTSTILDCVPVTGNR